MNKRVGSNKGGELTNVLGPLPRPARLGDFLPARDHGAILDWVVANPALFGAATVTTGQIDSRDRVSRDKRVALTTNELGPFEAMLTSRFFAALGEICARIGTPLAAQSLELEFSAHGDGGFFGPHIDIPTGAKRAAGDDQRQDRLLSAVYYFHREPRAFSGGALRLFRFGADPAGSGREPANHIDLAPVNNSLVAFASTVLHEVRPVDCPSDRFEDYRFALNCWYCRAL